MLDPDSRLYLVRAEKARSARQAAIERQLTASRGSGAASRSVDHKPEPMATLRGLLRQPAGRRDARRVFLRRLLGEAATA